jgi:hypothetical protein
MGKKKTETKQNQSFSNSYGFMNTPVTPQMQAVIDASNEKLQSRVDPSIFHRYASMKDDVERSYNDPFGAATSADVREKAKRSQMFKVDLERDKAIRESYDDRSGEQFARQMAAASLTMPQMVQTGGNSNGTQTTTQGGGMAGQIIGGALGVGAAAL